MRRTAPLVKPRVTDDGIWRRQVLSFLDHSLYLRTLLILLILLALRVQRTNTQKRDLAPPGPRVPSFTEKSTNTAKKYKY